MDTLCTQARGGGSASQARIGHLAQRALLITLLGLTPFLVSHKGPCWCLDETKLMVLACSTCGGVRKRFW